jgi:NO-binding membrane sensor protein with MHYT domain
MGAWLLKFVAFLGLVFALRDREAFDPVVLFFALIAAAVGTVAADVVAVLRSRVPYIDPAFPTPAADSTSGA